MLSWLVRQAELPSDLPRCLWINLSRRYGGNSVTDKNHHVSALAAPLLGSKRKTAPTGLIPKLGNEFVALIHSSRASKWPEPELLLSDNIVRMSRA
jgi:hypothetical protein